MSTVFAGYVCRECGRAFVAGLLLFVAVVSFGQLLKLTGGGVSLRGTDLLAACAFGLPPALALLLPIAWLYACLLTCARLAQDREVLALAQAGIRPVVLLRVPVAGGLALAVISALLAAYGEPWGIERLLALLGRAGQRALVHELAAGQFHHFGEGVDVYVAGREGTQLRGLMLARRQGDERLWVQARHAQIDAGPRGHDVTFTLQDADVVAGPVGAAQSRYAHFASGRYVLDASALVRAGKRTFTEHQRLGPRALYQRASTATAADERALVQILLHRKLALPLAAPIFGALAVPLGLAGRGGARARSLLLSGLLVGVYYYLGRSLELSARHGQLAAAWAAWLPDLAGLLALAPAWWWQGRGAR